jgi:hypothetical protein
MKVCDHEIRIQGKIVKIARLEGDLYHFIDDPEPILHALRENKVKADLFTFMQRLPDSAVKFKYPMEWDNLAAIPVSTFDQWRTQQITGEARNRTRQAEKKGVVIREVPFDDALVKGIWEIYNETPIRQGRPFRHFGKDLGTVYKEEATFLESSSFIGAFLGEKLIGFVKLTADQTRTQANLMNILSMIEHRDKAPTNALIAHSVKFCAEKGISFLVYQRFAYGNKISDGIMKFKKVNGFQKFDLPRYYVPLTPFGRMAFQLGLHHRLVDRLPEGLVSKVREFRNNWYNRRVQTAKESS